MNDKSNFRVKFHAAGQLLPRLLPGLLLLAAAGSAVAQQDYVGAEYCLNCHPLDSSEADNYTDWRTSGHRFILMSADQAQHRALPLPGGLSWDDISYVVGGHSTKALFLDQDGFIVTTSTDREGQPVDGMNQYNTLTGEWSDYHAGESKPYDCGACHTTGYLDRGNQDGLPGIVGNWAFPGVQCEACHGPGSTMEVNQLAEACGTCHQHPGTDGIEAVDGFIRSEGQYNEHQAGAHAELACVSCHNPHKPAEFGIKNQCEDCHSSLAAEYATTFKGEAGIQCEDCHMPYATLSAQPLGPHQGDKRTHIFNIDTRNGVSMFTDDGSMVKLTDGKAAVTLDFVCQRCHQGTPVSTLSNFAKGFHDPGRFDAQLQKMSLQKR
jgi:hypothetical protein